LKNNDHFVPILLLLTRTIYSLLRDTTLGGGGPYNSATAKASFPSSRTPSTASTTTRNHLKFACAIGRAAEVNQGGNVAIQTQGVEGEGCD